jgi:hypothetical protein
MQDRVSAVFTPADRQRVLDAVATIRDTMPFLASASTEDWQEMNKLGPKSRAFAEACLTASGQFQDILPRRFERGPFEQDLALFDALEAPFLAIQDLFERVNDTRMLVGSDAMESALEVYHYVKGAPGAGELNDTYATLRSRFKKTRRRAAPDGPDDPG